MKTTASHREKSLGTISPADVPVEMLPEVELSPSQLLRASALAHERNTSYDDIDGGDVYASDSLMSHFVGVVGEIAVASLYDTGIDAKLYTTGDDGSDLILANKRVDVKTTTTERMRRPELLVKAHKNVKADLFVLVHIVDWAPTGVTCRIHGCAPRDVVTDRNPRRHPGSDRNYVVSPDELTLPPLLRACQ